MSFIITNLYKKSVTTTDVKKFWWMLCALCVGVLAFHMRVRISLANPFDLSWMQHHDWAHHVQGWLFYREAPWQWPLGYFSNLLHPVGASVGLTDSIPWLAALFKIFAAWLPQNFQYFGAYLLLCFMLQSVFAFKILESFTNNRFYSLLGTVFFALAPVLLYRIVHIALCSQWMMLAGIFWYREAIVDPKKLKLNLVKVTLLNGLAAATHPYIWAMSFSVSAALFFLLVWKRSFSKFRFAALVGAFMLQPLFAVLTWWTFGYFLFESPAGGGFDYYRSDLTVFFNPMGEKALFPRISASGGQYEGYSYLGAGLIVLMFFLGARKCWDALRGEKLKGSVFRRYEAYGPLALMAFLLWIFALSSTPSFAGRVLFDLGPLYSLLEPIPNSFRSSGRFSWFLYYLLIIFLIVSLYKKVQSPRASWILGGLLLLQLYDLKRYYANIPMRYPLLSMGSDPFWSEAGKNFQHFVVWPQGSGGVCDAEKNFTPEQYRTFTFFAAQQKLTINVGAVSRFPESSVRQRCEELKTEIFEGRGREKTLYLLSPEEFKKLNTAANLRTRNFRCSEHDSYFVCANQ